MKTLLLAASALLLLATSSLAVTWHVVTVSVVVKQGSGNLDTIRLNTDDYLNFVSNRDTTPKAQLFVGIREDTGDLAVVRTTDETVRYFIVSGLGAGGRASNDTETNVFTSVSAVVSSLNTDFQGYIYDHFTRKPSGVIRSITRQFFGGFNNQTIKGNVRTTGRRVEL